MQTRTTIPLTQLVTIFQSLKTQETWQRRGVGYWNYAEKERHFLCIDTTKEANQQPIVLDYVAGHGQIGIAHVLPANKELSISIRVATVGETVILPLPESRFNSAIEICEIVSARHRVFTLTCGAEDTLALTMAMSPASPGADSDVKASDTPKPKPAHTYTTCQQYLEDRGFTLLDDNTGYAHEDGRKVTAAEIARAGSAAELERALQRRTD